MQLPNSSPASSLFLIKNICTNTHLTSILFQLTATLPVEGARIIKAVAILVNQLDLDNHADHMAITLMDTLKPPIEGLIQMGASIQTHTNHIIDSHELIKNCIIEMVSRVSDLHKAFCCEDTNIFPLSPFI